MIELSKFKAKIVQVGNSKGLRIPAKILEDNGIGTEKEYWVSIILERSEVSAVVE